MKKSAALLFFGFTPCAVVLLAQTNLPFRWSPVSWRFTIDGVPHAARIDHDAVVATKPWDPSKPLPLSFEQVERIARGELRRLAPNDGVWQVVGFDVDRLLSPLDSPNWYFVVHFRTSVPRQQGALTNYLENAQVLVDFNGKPGFFDGD